MLIYFYTDANGQKQGPIDGQQLLALMAQGTITAATPLETEVTEFTAAEQLEIDHFCAEHSTDVEATDEDGSTLLHKAAASKDVGIAVLKYLVSKGADVQAKDKYGATPLHEAAYNNPNVEVAKYLVSQGADVNANDEDGTTPLQLATQVDNSEMVALLLQHGAVSQAKPTPPPKTETDHKEAALALQRSLSLSNPSVEGFNTYFTVFWIGVVVGMLLFGLAIQLDRVAGILPFGALLLYQCWNLIHVAFVSILLYLCWKLIPVDIARTTPGKAVGYCFIFNLYWFFVAFHGLGKDMNKTLQQNGVTYRVNEGFGLAYCILAVAMCTSNLIVFFADNSDLRNTWMTVFFIVGIAFPIVGIFFLKSVKNGAVALLEPERANEIQSHKEAALARSGESVFTKIIGSLSAAKDAVQARLRLNTLNTQLVANYRSLGDVAEQAGWDGALSESIRKQREEVAAIISQQEKAAADAELTQNTPSAGEAKQALADVKKRAAFASSLLDGLREKAGRKLLDDATAPANIGTEQRIEITRLTAEMVEHERVIAHGKASLLTKPVLATAAAAVLLVLVGGWWMMGSGKPSGGRGKSSYDYSESPSVVNAKDKDGWTPLHFAAAEADVEGAKSLISKGANVNAKTYKGMTPLGIAEYGQLMYKSERTTWENIQAEAMVRYLISVGGKR